MPLPIVLALLLQAAPADANPLARGLAGDLQCYTPDAQRKTCRALASYRPRAGGGYDNGSVTLISPAGPVTMEVTSPVVVKGQSVCGYVRASDLATAKLRVAGRLLTEAEAAPGIAQLQQAMMPVLDKEICTTYVPDGERLIAKSSIAGVYQAALDQPVSWVRPGDNYSVAP